MLHQAAAGERAARAPLTGPGGAGIAYAAANTVVAECEQAVAAEETRRMVRRVAGPDDSPADGHSGRETAATLTDVVRRIGVALAVDRVYLRVSMGASDRGPLVAQWHREGLTPLSAATAALPAPPG